MKTHDAQYRISVITQLFLPETEHHYLSQYDEKPVNEEEKKAENIKHSQEEVEEEIMPSNGVELLNRKETYMVEVWKDGRKDHTIRVIDIW